MITPEQTTFRRLQTDSAESVTVFLSLDGTLADGSTITGPWEAFNIALTSEELTMAAAIIARAREEFVNKINEEPIIIEE